ncbi:MAG: glycine cleavage system aminomethyltransferase GcvT [Burkholderiales bacterium]|nr:glycine cleavage system aminomethyltransferase GcvT [Burkholderiales bacterium]
MRARARPAPFRVSRAPEASVLEQTVLNGIHREAGAKLVDFGGWEMPLHYGSQIEEHHAVRRAAGMFDVSHMRVVEVLGGDARAFLRRALANDVAKLAAPGRALYSCMLNEAGGVVDDLVCYALAGDAYRLVVNAGTGAKDLAWLGRIAREGGFAVEIAARPDVAIIAVQGPEARARCWQAFPALRAGTEALVPFASAFFRDWFVARTGYTGEDGFEIVLPGPLAAMAWRALARAGVRPCGLGARDTLRLEAGLNLYGQDMDESTSPLESGLGWTVDRRAGRDFVGRAALDASQPTRALRGLVLAGDGVLRAHQRISTDHGEGEVTSGTFSPTLARSIALARLPAAVAPGDRVSVDIRGRRLAAVVVAPPFVRQGKSLVDSHLTQESRP